jgi:glucosamine--fructose-6-phosphate aminotransferase (isomerizing)
MCGIVGYTGWREAQPILINNLAKLEYCGYDSCGIALRGSALTIMKDAVRVAELAKSLKPSHSTTGIGHTRWATHGPPSKINAHPHPDCTGQIAVVHNGIINNYQKLRKQLSAEGHKFVSETDTEVISHLVEKYFKGNLEEAVYAALKVIEGSYAIIVIAKNEPGLVFARKDSPLIIGVGDKEYFIASDVTAILEYTNRVIYLEDGDAGRLTPEDIKITHHGQPVKREEQKILWTAEQAQKGGYEHYMLKEIHEQPRVIREMLAECLAVRKTGADFNSLYGEAKAILMLACGTSYHAAMIGKYVTEKLLDISVRLEMASEFNYLSRTPFFPLTIGFTQSGETADTLKALRRAKEAQSKVLVITNVVGSTASKLSDYTLYTRAGPEMSVAATKSFIAQLAAIYWLALSQLDDTTLSDDLISEFRQLPSKVQEALDLEDIIVRSANKLAGYENVFFVGRGLNYPVAMEGALKLKEISYIHSEAFAAGEIKHGPFALLSPKTPVIAIVTRDNCHDAMLTTINEIRARGAPVFAIVEDSDETIIDLADYLIPVPSTLDIFSPFITTVVMQMLAYFTAKKRGCPIDFPRNLAKSVTVE